MNSILKFSMTRYTCYSVALSFALSIGGNCLWSQESTQAEQSQNSEQANQQSKAESGEASTETIDLSLAEGNLSLAAPTSWKKVEPRFNLIEAEFLVEKTGEDEKDGRLTIMASGGSIEQNIDRWCMQFSQPNGKPSKDVATIEQVEINGIKVHRVDISGTFADRPGGPVSPPVLRDHYRMMAAICETKHGNYFIKFYGPHDTITANETKFSRFVESLKPSEK